jgi:hypothetical protein
VKLPVDDQQLGAAAALAQDAALKVFNEQLLAR